MNYDSSYTCDMKREHQLIIITIIIIKNQHIADLKNICLRTKTNINVSILNLSVRQCLVLFNIQDSTVDRSNL